MRILIASLVLGVTLPALAQERPRVSDNSFLLEEAYNQEPGVIQHAGTFRRNRAGAWEMGLTTEVPFRSQRHQLSLTATLHRSDLAGRSGLGLGDMELNYRWQALGSEGRSVWMAPNLTTILPVGEAEWGRGSGGVGFEASVPISITLSSRFTTHFNIGAFANPGAQSRRYPGVPIRGGFVGASLVGDVSSRINLLFEALYEAGHESDGLGGRESFDGWIVSPGIRWAHDFSSGLQIVPGIAYNFDLSTGNPENAVYLYLSFEYPFRKTP